jgi:hypothetical protein
MSFAAGGCAARIVDLQAFAPKQNSQPWRHLIQAAASGNMRVERRA